MSTYSTIGKSLSPIGAWEKVMGKALYSGDVKLSGMLHGKILRSPFPHARILRIDISKAQALKGVAAVVTSDDVPWQRTSREVPDSRHTLFARDKALFFGQPVAAVAAATREIAQEACGLIHVEYEELPVVEDVLQAMKADAPLLHPTLYTETLAGKAEKPSNVSLHVEFERGDVVQGFGAADLIIEKTFRTQTIHQGYLEPRAAVAVVGPDGKVTVWASSQGSFQLRQLLAEVLQVPLWKVRVMPMEVGGGFGAKASPVAAPICVVLAQKAGVPVKLVLTREEEFTSTRPAPSAVIDMRIGVTKKGSLTAVSGSVIFDCGAFPAIVAAAGVLTGLGHYRIPNLKFDGYNVVTNRPPTGAYRAPGAPQVNFAVESVMDVMARSLDLDPIEFRLRNIAAEGDPMPNDVPFPRVGFRETLEKAAQALHYNTRLEGKNRGRGVACGLWLGGVGSSAASVNLNADGSVALVVGSIDLTGTRTALAQIAAEEMGIPIQAVTVVTADTDTAPYSDITAGSRTTHQMGAAVCRACHDAKAQLAQRAARRLEADPSDIEFVDGKLRLKHAPDRYVTLLELARASITSSEGAVIGRGAVSVAARIPTFSAHITDVEVDPETGKAKVLSYTIAQDVGLAVNPMLIEGQMEGAVAQGIGWAMSEGYVFDRGIPKNTTLLDYRMPTSMDVPFIGTEIVEVSCPTSPYGIRGVGEAPFVPSLAALANGIDCAVGVRLTELPMTPEAVFWALKHREALEAVDSEPS